MEPRARFTSELRAIQDDVVSLGRMVGVAIDQSVEALKGRDTDLGKNGHSQRHCHQCAALCH